LYRELREYTMNNTYNELFSSLSAVIENFIQEVKNKKSDSMTGDEWSVKDQLCHIVFGTKIMPRITKHWRHIEFLPYLRACLR